MENHLLHFSSWLKLETVGLVILPTNLLRSHMVRTVPFRNEALNTNNNSLKAFPGPCCGVSVVIECRGGEHPFFSPLTLIHQAECQWHSPSQTFVVSSAEAQSPWLRGIASGATLWVDKDDGKKLVTVKMQGKLGSTGEAATLPFGLWAAFRHWDSGRLLLSRTLLLLEEGEGG